MSYWKHNIEGINWSELKLWEREMAFKQVCLDNNVDLEQSPYAIMWEDPEDLDGTMKVTTPSPTWWAMALHGNILPPVEVYWELKHDESQPGFKQHTRGHLLHETEPMPPMTEEEAIGYLIMKDLPPSVWNYKGNRTIMKIVPRELIPSDRSFRNAWKIKQETESV
jgi:hypothetical protein